MDFSGIVDDLIQCQNAEIHGHELDDGMQPRHGGADSQAREAGFRDRGIHHPLRAEFFHETLTDFEGALVVAHFLADQENARVSTHLLPHGLVQRFPIGEQHGWSYSSRITWVCKADGVGKELSSANLTAEVTTSPTSRSSRMKSVSAPRLLFKIVSFSMRRGSRLR